MVSWVGELVDGCVNDGERGMEEGRDGMTSSWSQDHEGSYRALAEEWEMVGKDSPSKWQLKRDLELRVTATWMTDPGLVHSSNILRRGYLNGVSWKIAKRVSTD